jgi:hypothetical protein
MSFHGSAAPCRLPAWGGRARFANGNCGCSGEPAQLQQYGRALSRFLIHPDFESLVDDTAHLVLEVDRDMAAIPWEMLHRGEGTVPLSIRRPLARELRTTYSPRPTELMVRTRLRGLVIGDPARENGP